MKTPPLPYSQFISTQPWKHNFNFQGAHTARRLWPMRRDRVVISTSNNSWHTPLDNTTTTSKRLIGQRCTAATFQFRCFQKTAVYSKATSRECKLDARLCPQLTEFAGGRQFKNELTPSAFSTPSAQTHTTRPVAIRSTSSRTRCAAERPSPPRRRFRRHSSRHPRP